MEIIDNKALVLKTRDPDKVTQVIPQSHVVSQTQTPSGVGYEVAVKWTLANAKILQNLGFKNVPSPIVGQYNWPGMYKPFEHQKDTASFLTLNQRAFCLNDMGCVDSETEYLSPTGWKKISEYLEGDVAQYLPDTGAIEFVPPEAYVKKPCTDMIHFKTKYGVDQMLSPEHRMLVSDNASKTNKTAVMSAAYMQYRHDAKHRKEKIIHGRDTISFAHAATPATYIRPWGQGLAITDAELRLQVAVIADGHFSGNTTRCVMRLKKERKVGRLKEILKETGIAYVETTPEYESAEGFHIFKFDSPIKLKEFDERFYKCSAEQIDIIYNEVLHWDGCIRKGIKANEFSSTSRVSADFVQMVFNSKGHIARITEDKRENRNTCYNVTIRELGKQHLGYYSTTTKTVFDCKSTDGFKYCFTVPSTFLLFRRNGCVFASGNTGKTMSVIWAADYLMTKKIIKRVLVICPLSIMDPAWRADLFKTAMHRMVDIAHGSRDKRIKVIKSDAEFVIINYDGIEIVANEIAKGGFDLIVCDEASALKTPTTKRWKTLNSLITQHTWLWLLTGTPAAQSPMDAYGLAKILRPDSVPRYIGAFKDKVMLKITQFKYIPRPEAQDIVYKVLQPAIRYTKEECLDLPELTYTERDTPMTAQQRKYYDLLKKEMMFEAAGEEVSAVNAAIKMNKLLQISCIGYNTPVLTNLGWKPIQTITSKDFIWDGIEWVKQDGAIERGLKHVEKCFGVYMTLDHKVLTESGWSTAQDILYGKSSKKLNRADVWLPYSNGTSRDYYRNGCQMRNVVMSMPVWDSSYKKESIFTRFTSKAPKKLWVSPWERNSQNEQHPVLQQLPQYVREVPQQKRQRFQKLRSKRDIRMRNMEEVFYKFLGRYERYVQKRIDARQNRQQRTLLERKLQMDFSGRAREQHPKQYSYSYFKRKNDRGSSRFNIWYKTWDPSKKAKSRVAHPLSVNNSTEQEQKTFDLLNCGPRQRFVVLGETGPLIVHNCGAAYSDTGEVVEFDCSVRLKEMTEIIEQSSHKVLVFANFKHGIVTIKRHLDSLGITSDVIHGGVSANNRTKIFNQFQLEKDPQVLIIQPKAAAHGVTLHAANTIIWWGPITSTETYLQANARVHRQGQKNPCTVVHLVGSSVERSLYASLTSKTEAQNTLLNMYKNIFGLI
jgi:hypothetical protein